MDRKEEMAILSGLLLAFAGGAGQTIYLDLPHWSKVLINLILGVFCLSLCLRFFSHREKPKGGIEWPPYEPKNHKRFEFFSGDEQIVIECKREGNGLPVLVKAANWFSDIELDPDSLVWKHWVQDLSERFDLIRYDERNCGRSTRDLKDDRHFTIEAWAEDLEAVVDRAAKNEKFHLLGVSQGGPVAIKYASMHKDRIKSLSLYGTFSVGWNKRNDLSSEKKDLYADIRRDIKKHWGSEKGGVFISRLILSFTPNMRNMEFADFKNDFLKLQERSVKRKAAVKFFDAFGNIDITDELRLIAHSGIPVRVFHSDEDGAIPLEWGMEVADKLTSPGEAGEVLYRLKSKNHILMKGEKAWQVFLDELVEFVKKHD